MKRNILKPILAMLLLFICSSAAMSQTLVVWQKDGNSVRYSLDAMPITTFTTEELIITTNTKTITYPLSNILRYTYENVSTSIDGVTNQNGISISHNDNRIIVKGLKKGESASIYRVDGSLILSKTTDGTLDVVFPLDALNYSVYIVKAKGVNYKVLVR